MMQLFLLLFQKYLHLRNDDSSHLEMAEIRASISKTLFLVRASGLAAVLAEQIFQFGSIATGVFNKCLTIFAAPD